MRIEQKRVMPLAPPWCEVAGVYQAYPTAEADLRADAAPATPQPLPSKTPKRPAAQPKRPPAAPAFDEDGAKKMLRGLTDARVAKLAASKSTVGELAEKELAARQELRRAEAAEKAAKVAEASFHERVLQRPETFMLKDVSAALRAKWEATPALQAAHPCVGRWIASQFLARKLV